jgi:hypothetical protein
MKPLNHVGWTLAAQRDWFYKLRSDNLIFTAGECAKKFSILTDHPAIQLELSATFARVRLFMPACQ